MKVQRAIFRGFVLGLLFHTSVNAQNKITIDYKTQRFVGEASEFNRDKYLNFHIKQLKEDKDFNDFVATYQLNPAYFGSRSVWNPLGRINNGKIPWVKKKYSGVRDVNYFVDTGRARSVFYQKEADYSVVDASEFMEKSAQFAVDFYRYSEENVPMFYEPFNEPMVHAQEFYPQNGKNHVFIKEKIEKIAIQFSEFHRILGAKIHAAPELKHMKVMGCAAAYPEFEHKDFYVWNSKFKTFMDIAGAEMDLFSIHIYDGSGHVNNKAGRRSGSNSEAILDLLEAYSYVSFGKVKPIAVTEYGRLVQDQAGFPKVGNYEAVENSQAVRSQIHMVMNFIERGEDIAITIPFTTGKILPKSKYSKAALWTTDARGDWELTPRKYFFEIWKDIRGKRVAINSSNIDIQTQAFVDGNKLYVVLNNLNDASQTTALHIVNASGFKKGSVKSLKIFKDKTPELTVENFREAPAEVSLAYGETKVLTYEFKKPIAFEKSVRSSKYYAKKCVVQIHKNKVNEFAFENVQVGAGNAFLRLSIGRMHGKSLTPKIKINGTEVVVQGDVVRGYNQHNRKQFFGTLEIPVSIEVLKNGTNKLEVTFSDYGGQISSAVLQIEKFDE